MMTLFSQAPAEGLPPAPEEAPADEARLVQATLGADPRAFEEIVHRHSRRVFTFLHHFARHRQDAEDLTQQTFLKAYQNLHRFDCNRPLINWLLTIARRTALNHFRAAKKWEAVPETTACPAPSPADRAEDKDDTDSLWARARRILSPREFEVLWLRFAEEMSTEETARIAGITQTHVKVLVYRARQQLLKGEISP
jgi:RNA polymerase sigma-70 factor (ECF subfamily)